MVVSEKADEIELDNHVTIMVKTSDFLLFAVLTLAAVVADEVCFWDSQGVSPDTEIFAALRPAMATIPGSKLIAISSPYTSTGRCTKCTENISASIIPTFLSGRPKPAR